MFLKEKRCGKIKGRGCADGRKQWVYTTKQETSSPTVAIELLMISCVIDAKEHRDVATVDIPGASMVVDMDEEVHMRLEGTMVELVVRLSSKTYKDFVVKEGNKDVLYVQLKKALYGTLRAALLFWKKLTEVLKGWGFETNPYDWCVANKVIDGDQCTIVWHIDDLKISHQDPAVVVSIIKQLEGEFGKEAVERCMGYLGMTQDYTCPGKVAVT
jgi:Reverse transcriptase (RNA-dependent DNA polymerase)